LPIADCRLPIADCLTLLNQIGNRQLEIGNDITLRPRR
jgi:hypothetical protein